MTKRNVFATAAAVFAVGTFAAAAQADVVCSGGNACKGKSACKTACKTAAPSPKAKPAAKKTAAKKTAKK